MTGKNGWILGDIEDPVVAPTSDISGGTILAIIGITGIIIATR